jgi:amphi-Trp domain-containing protein
MSSPRDTEMTYPIDESIAPLRRLADCLEAGEQLEIQIARERIYVPVRARYNIDHEREGGSREIEFQIKWDD